MRAVQVSVRFTRTTTLEVPEGLSEQEVTALITKHLSAQRGEPLWEGCEAHYTDGAEELIFDL